MRMQYVLDACYERYLRRQLKFFPNHIAVIQDGNRRYALQKKIESSMGHRAGADTTEKLLDWVQNLGIRHLTIYSFSTENFSRSHDEIENLFTIFKDMLRRIPIDERVHRNKLCVRVVGERNLLPDDLIDSIEQAEKATEQYSNYFLNIALAYGGRNEIVHATRSILSEVMGGKIRPDDITMEFVEKHLNRGIKIPPVDLIIRTGNEKRTSNFLPWLANGNESAVYFCAPYWPSFRKIDLLRAIRVYDQRVRMSHHLPNRRLLN